MPGRAVLLNSLGVLVKEPGSARTAATAAWMDLVMGESPQTADFFKVLS